MAVGSYILVDGRTILCEINKQVTSDIGKSYNCMRPGDRVWARSGGRGKMYLGKVIRRLSEKGAFDLASE